VNDSTLDPAAIGALLDRMAIEHLLSRYPFLVDRQRFEELGQLFAEDGVMDGPVSGPVVGRSAIEAFFRHSATKPITGRVPRFMRHNVTSQRVDVGPDGTAAADSYFLAMTDAGPDHWGRYRDSLVKVGGEWLFHQRLLKVDGHAAGSWWEQNIAGAST